MNVNMQLLASVKLIAFDFDGVFTDNTVYVRGGNDKTKY